MKDQTDQELLDRYTNHGDETAFAELVSRYLDLVHSAALRQVGGNFALAQEASQQVFLLLAKQTWRLVRHPSVPGWLYTTTRYTTHRIVRTEQRRQAREQQAPLVNESTSTSEVDWTVVAPVLDAAMHELKPADREVILRRFFDRRKLSSVGAALEISEEAARKRTTRALEKLRVNLAKNGVTSTATALGLALEQGAVAAAPSGLAAKVASASLAGITGPLTFQAKLVQLMATTKLHSNLCLLVTLALLTPVVWQQQSLSAVVRETRAMKGLLGTAHRIDSPLASTIPAKELTADELGELARRRGEFTELLSLRGQIGQWLRTKAARKAFSGQLENAESLDRQEQLARQSLRSKWVGLKLSESVRLEDVSHAGLETPTDALRTFFAALKNANASALAAISYRNHTSQLWSNEQWQEFNEIRMTDLRNQNTDGVEELQLVALRKYGDDTVDIFFNLEAKTPRKAGRPPAGFLGLRRVGEIWWVERYGNFDDPVDHKFSLYDSTW